MNYGNPPSLSKNGHVCSDNKGDLIKCLHTNLKQILKQSLKWVIYNDYESSENNDMDNSKEQVNYDMTNSIDMYWNL